jgi:hypothetical protein
MNKRDTIIVVFRVVAIFILFLGFSAIVVAISDSSRQQISATSTETKLILSILSIGLPFGIAYLLWNKSGWIADKILAPFGMDQLWDDAKDSEIEDTDLGDSEESFSEPEKYTFTHLSRAEIESLCLTIVGVWVLTSSLPELARSISFILSTSLLGKYEIITLISPALKTGIAILLLLKSNNLVAWLAKWRGLRMKD